MKIAPRSMRLSPILILYAMVIMLSLSASPHRAFAQSMSMETLEAREAKSNWLKARFTLDNSRYAATRAQIDRLVRQGQKPGVLEHQYRLQGDDRNDPQKVFRWAYAAYRKQKLNPQMNGLFGLEEAMNRNRRPGAYDWVRLRFLVASLQTFLRPTMELIDVGRRLLHVKSADEEVTYHFIRNLQISQLLKDRKQAVVLAKANARKYPRDLYWQWLVADSVNGVNTFTAHATYSGNHAAIREYKKTLHMLPPGHPYRKRIIEGLVSLDLDFDSSGQPVTWNLKMYKEALKKTTLR